MKIPDLINILIEIIGTFFFISIILNSLTDKRIGPIGIAVGLLAAIYFGGKMSSGHFNPIVTISFFMKNKIQTNVMICYILAQIIGGLSAVEFNNWINKFI